MPKATKTHKHKPSKKVCATRKMSYIKRSAKTGAKAHCRAKSRSKPAKKPVRKPARKKSKKPARKKSKKSVKKTSKKPAGKARKTPKRMMSDIDVDGSDSDDEEFFEVGETTRETDLLEEKRAREAKLQEEKEAREEYARARAILDDEHKYRMQALEEAIRTDASYNPNTGRLMPLWERPEPDMETQPFNGAKWKLDHPAHKGAAASAPRRRKLPPTPQHKNLRRRRGGL